MAPTVTVAAAELEMAARRSTCDRTISVEPEKDERLLRLLHSGPKGGDGSPILKRPVDIPEDYHKKPKKKKSDYRLVSFIVNITGNS